jgi:hypothetical protein
LPGNVTHVKRQDQRAIHLHELGGKIKITLHVGRINDVDDDIRLLFDYEVSGDKLFDGVGGEAVGSRQINAGHFVVTVNAEALFLLDGYARVVAYMLPCAGEHIKDCGLSAVGIAGERHSYFLHEMSILTKSAKADYQPKRICS